MSFPADKSVEMRYKAIMKKPSYDRDTALEAALQLFWQKGYHATSLKDLEAALDMKPGSIYAAFQSKEKLYLATLERYFDRGLTSLRASIESAPSITRGLADHLRRIGQCAKDDEECRPCMLVKTLIDVTATDPSMATQSEDYLAAMKAEFESLFEHARTNGELPTNVNIKTLAHRYQLNLIALKIDSLRQTDETTMSAVAEDMARELEMLAA